MKKAWVLSYLLSAQQRLIRLGGCPGWSKSSLGAQPHCWFWVPYLNHWQHRPPALTIHDELLYSPQDIQYTLYYQMCHCSNLSHNQHMGHCQIPKTVLQDTGTLKNNRVRGLTNRRRQEGNDRSPESQQDYQFQRKCLKLQIWLNMDKC